MDLSDTSRHFTRTDGSYQFARWGRPIVPVIFGVEAETLSIFKGAIEASVALVGHKMAETDPELGANLMFFLFREWSELPEVPNLDRMIPDLGPLCARLEAAGANQYRSFRFDDDGAIRAVFVFLRMDKALSSLPAEGLALAQAVQAMLLWSDQAFAERSPLAKAGEALVLRPEIAALMQAAYDPVMPMVSNDPNHALRLSARAGLLEARQLEQSGNEASA